MIQTPRTLFRQPDGSFFNGLAFAYIFSGCFGGFALLMVGGGVGFAAGTVLLAHSLIVAAYMLHELCHHSIFRSTGANARWGTVMTWLTGSCYAGFEPLRRKHMRHHLDRADIVTLDIKAFLRRHPLLFRVVIALEWMWIPAVELLMHAYVIALPFVHASRRDQRPRVVRLLLVRGVLFGVLGWFAPQALIGYAMAYVAMTTVLRFADAYQHTYDAFEMDADVQVPDDKLRDRAYERMNTYSNLVSLRWPFLNLLLLNFGYHNAHHERPVASWHQLPALHRRLYPGECAQLLPMRTLVTGFHRHRLERLLRDDYGQVHGSGNKARDFIGAVGVSFLTAA
jgi:fatty acid desaturase